MESETYKKIFESLHVGITVMHFDDINDIESLRTVVINRAAMDAIGTKASMEDLTTRRVLEVTPGIRTTGMIDQWRELLKKGEDADLGNVHYPGDEDIPEAWFATHFHTLSKDTYYLEFTNITEQIKMEEKVKASLEETKQMNAHMIDRELKMVQLKDEIKRLRETIGSDT